MVEKRDNSIVNMLNKTKVRAEGPGFVSTVARDWLGYDPQLAAAH